MGQIQQLDSSLERAIEAYNLANVKLARIRHDLKDNTNALVVAKKSLAHAQAQLSARIVDIYTSGDQNAGLAVLLGASSLDDMLGRMDASDRVSEQDSLVVKQVARFRREVQHRQRFLQHAHAEQVQVVAERNAARASVESAARRAQAAARLDPGRDRPPEGGRGRQAGRAPAPGAVRGPGGVAAAGIARAHGRGSAPAARSRRHPTAPPATHGGVVGIAMQYLGTPYVWGGASPSGFDCSGFVMYVYGQMGVSLPHSSYAQYGYGSPVSLSQLQAGDLVFFDGLGHVGIYVGGGSFIHAPHTGDVVKISSLSGWYASTFVGGRRL